MKTRTRRILAGAAAAAALAMVAVHVPMVQRMTGDSCPFGGPVAATPAERDARRLAASARLVEGDPVVAGRPAGDFELGRTTRADVAAWSASRGAPCRLGIDRVGLACTEEADQPDGAALYADFAADGRLVSVLSLSYHASAAAAVDELALAEQTIERAVGEPSRQAGERGATYLEGGVLRQRRLEFRRQDYFAAVSATRLGEGRFLVSRLFREL